MSFRQIFDRISRIARSELGGSRNSTYERDLRRAKELIEEARRREHGEPDPADEPRSSVRDEEAEAYRAACATLGVQPGASWDEVTAAFRRRAREVHPDRAASLSESEQRLAHRRMQELNAAYELLERRMRR